LTDPLFLCYDYIMNDKSSVYFVADLNSNAFKIGKADDVYRRIGELQTGNPNPLTLLHAIEFQSSDESFFYEKKYHQFFKHFHLNGEWFKFNEEILKNFLLKEIKIEPKSKRNSLTIYTLFGEETFDIKKFPRCFFYPYLVAQIKESYEKSINLTIPFRTMSYPTKGKKMLGQYSQEVNRVFISGKKHLENLEYNAFLKEKELKVNSINHNTLETFL